MKLMFTFLTFIIVISSYSSKNIESVPIYETPVIVKGLQGNQSAKVALSNVQRV
jgi:hypothetical protein